MQMHTNLHMCSDDIRALQNGSGFSKLGSGGVFIALSDSVNLFVPDECLMQVARALMRLASGLMDMQDSGGIDEEDNHA